MADYPRPGTYVWRDPARVSPARLAELAAHDTKVAAMDRKKPPASAHLHFRVAARARVTEFTRLREAGVSVDAAGELVGVAPSTAWKYEWTRRREAKEAGDGQA
jgi:hypothetical protein